jgi:DNA-binding NtrC family response regulator
MAAPRVLVVDDDPLVLSLVTRILARQGYDVLSAPGPTQALVLAASMPPIDLVVSDVQMPGMKGPALVKEITSASPSTAAILMSGYVERPDPASDVIFLHKPFSVPELVEAVERVLATAASARQQFSRLRDDGERLRAQADALSRDLTELGEEISRKQKRLQRLRDGECLDEE